MSGPLSPSDIGCVQLNDSCVQMPNVLFAVNEIGRPRDVQRPHGQRDVSVVRYGVLPCAALRSLSVQWLRC